MTIGLDCVELEDYQIIGDEPMHHVVDGFMRKSLLAILLTISIIGCSSHATISVNNRRAFEGEPRPENELAILRTKNKFQAFREHSIVTDVMAVDGMNIVEYPHDRKSPYHTGKITISIRDVEMLPGKHTLDVSHYLNHCVENFYIVGFTVPCTHLDIYNGRVSFVAEAGKIYHLESELKNGQIYFWIEESESGVVVSNEKPPIEGNH